MATLQIPTAEAFVPLLSQARIKGAHGGRGSGKSQFFVDQGIKDALRFPGDYGEGLRWLCFRENQKDLKESAKFLIEKKLETFGLGERQGFKVFRDVIKTPKDGLIAFTGMKDHTADSIKSYEGFQRAWGEEAQAITSRSIDILKPTLRWETDTGGYAELWFSWNPTRPTDAVERLLRSDVKPDDAVVVSASWRQNPWFPKVLNRDRLDCLKNEPDKYAHIWEGEFATVLEGAYYAKHLNQARLDSRIGIIARDPLIKIHAFWDIGGTGKKSDATAIWIVQFVQNEIRVLDYYEAQGQPFEAHVNWLRDNGYGDAVCVLPHDGQNADKVYAVTPQGYLNAAGFQHEVVRNQGTGAALRRVDATRRIFGRFHFNEARTKGGREALGWYHAKLDEARGIDLGPEHDFSSHAADAFGMIAVWDASRGGREREWSKPLRRNVKGVW